VSYGNVNMSVKIASSGNNADVPLNELQHLPCTVKMDEAANVKSYFLTKFEDKNGKQSLQATFRGRLLDGSLIHLPENYCGYVLNERKKPFSEEEDRTLEVTGKFKYFIQWHLDSQYSSTNVTARACSTWPGQLAEAIHKPISSED